VFDAAGMDDRPGRVRDLRLASRRRALRGVLGEPARFAATSPPPARYREALRPSSRSTRSKVVAEVNLGLLILRRRFGDARSHLERAAASAGSATTSCITPRQVFAALCGGGRRLGEWDRLMAEARRQIGVEPGRRGPPDSATLAASLAREAGHEERAADAGRSRPRSSVRSAAEAMSTGWTMVVLPDTGVRGASPSVRGADPVHPRERERLDIRLVLHEGDVVDDRRGAVNVMAPSSAASMESFRTW
jgi:hypothetical protein